MSDAAGSAQDKKPRAVAFVDGQNLFHSARECFEYYYPNYDVRLLAGAFSRC